MGKVGDLIVRLKLQYQDYQKGLKKASGDTTSFGHALGKIKGVGLAVWAAIGASAIKLGQDMLKATNRIGDAWDRMTAGMQAGWDTFVKALSNFDFNGFFARLKSATAAAKELQGVLDAQYEGNNSIRLQKALMSEEITALKVAMRDQTKSYKERLTAAENYIKKIKPIYEQESTLAKNLMEAQMGKWLAGTSLNDNNATRDDLIKFIIDYSTAKNKELVDDISSYLKASKGVSSYESLKSNLFGFNDIKSVYAEQYKEDKKTQEVLKAKLEEWGKENGYTNFIGDLAEIYEKWRGDLDTTPLVDAIIAAEKAENALNEETIRVQNLINSYKAAIEAANKSQIEKLEDLLNKVKKERNSLANEIAGLLKDAKKELEEGMDLSLDEPNLELGLKIVEDEMDGFITRFKEDVDEVKALNNMLSNTIANSLSGATQALMDCLVNIEGADATAILQALLQPFASTMVSLGEELLAYGFAIEAFKSSSLSLQGGPAIAAGLALIAAGAALSAGIQKMGGGSSSASAGSEAANSTSSSGYQTYEQEITVYVVGEIQGDKIVISGQKVLSKWNR